LVVAAIIEDPCGRVLLGQRPVGKAAAGKWEFPGGKIEPGETALAALKRELQEELGLQVIAAVHLMTVTEVRAEGDLQLMAFRVQSHRGKPEAREQQGLRWQHPDDLDLATLPEADRPIAASLRLPRYLLITPDPMLVPAAAFLAHLGKRIATTKHLVRLRSASALPAALIQAVESLVVGSGSQLLLSTDDFPHRCQACTGLHLRSSQLAADHRRPVPATTLLMASVHHLHEARHARDLGCDLALIAPISATLSHPGQAGIGWAGFAALHAACTLPAYALGGLGAADLAEARAHGALGVAGIRAFWQ